MEFPSTVPIKQINSKHADVDAEKTNKYNALYEGGSAMTQKIKEQIIIKRQNEIKFQPEVYNQRVARAYYINRAGGVIDYIVSNATMDTPRIMVSEKADEEQKKFWSYKNIDADNYGTPFASIFRQLLKDELVTKRPYIQVEIIDDDIGINRMDPGIVIDWGINDDGTPWVKTYAWNMIKSSPFQEEQLIEHIWTIYTPEESIVYKAISKKTDNPLYQNNMTGIYEPDSKAVATLSEEDSVHGHDFPILPIIKANPHWWLMDRISENIMALYNAESDLSWVLAESAYPQGIIQLESEARFQQFYNKSECAIWNLLPTEDYKIVSATGTDFEAHFKNVDRLKVSLYESMQMMAKEASQIPQAGRLSGEAIKEMKNPLTALLQSFTWPILDAMYETIEAIKIYRGEEDLPVWIEGLNISVNETDLRKLLLGEELQDVSRRDEGNEGRDTEEESGETEEGGEEGGRGTPIEAGD